MTTSTVFKRRAFWKDIIRELRQSRNRFLSILVMIALASMFLCGLRSTSPDMQLTSDKYYDVQRLMDLRVVSTLGLTEEDVKAFAALEGVACAEGGYSLDAILTQDAQEMLLKLQLLPQEVNQPVLLEGRLPEAADECAVERRVRDSLGLKVGDTVSFSGNDSLEENLCSLRYRVTGVVDSPVYIGMHRGTSSLGDGEVDAFVLLPQAAFRMEYFTEIWLLAKDAEPLLCYSDEYETLVDELSDRVEPVGERQVQQRFETLRDEAQQDLDEAAAELNDGERELAEQEAKSRAELADARIELNDSWAEYETGCMDYERELADAEQTLAAAAQKLTDGQKALNEAELQLEQGRQELLRQEDEADTALLDAEQQLAEQRTLLEEAEEKYSQGLEAQQEGERQRELGRQQGLTLARNLAELDQQIAAAQMAGMDVSQFLAMRGELQMVIDELAMQLQQADAALDEGAAQLAASRTELDAGWEQFNAVEEQLAEQRTETELQLELAWRKVHTAENEIYSAKLELAQGQADYEAGLAELEQSRLNGQAQLDDALEQLESGERDYSDGLAQLETELADARAELADGWLELADAQAELDNLERGKLYLLDRSSLPDYIAYEQDSERMDRLGNVFPVLFFVVAALVCLTTMTRMVEEQRMQIGALKAIGYGTWAVAQKFMVYGCLAALLGTMIGCIVGTYLFPWIICFCYGIMYTLPAAQLPWHWGTCVGVGFASVACTLAAVLWAVWASVRCTPAELMRPRAPKAGKRILLERIGFVWKRLNFSMKVSARNLFRYQKRLWMTVIGVGGCTALIIAGFGLQEGILAVIDRQFGEIYHFDLLVTMDENASEARQQEALEWILSSDEHFGSASADLSTVTCSGAHRSEECYLLAAENSEALTEQFLLRDSHSGEVLSLPEEGCVITQKLAELLDLTVGNELIIDVGERIPVRIAAIAEQYVQHYVVFSPQAYEAAFGEPVQPNTVYLTLRDHTDEAASAYTAQLLDMPGIVAVTNLNAQGRSFRDNMSVVNYAVVIIIISAAALAFTVLYNLTNINITERIRELATLKVLGFFDGELAMYVYRENIVLTLMGIALGQLFGRFLSTYLVCTIEIDMVMFGRYATWRSYAWSIALSLVFALLVNVVMYFRLKKIDMVESLKSVE